MKNGEGSACFINAPFDCNLITARLKRLATLSDYFPAYPGPIAATRRAWAREHKAELIAFIRGYNQAYAWLQDGANQAAAIAMLPARLDTPADAAAQALQRIFSRPRPRITEDGVRQAAELVWMAEQFSQAKGEPAKYMDLSYLQAAEG